MPPLQPLVLCLAKSAVKHASICPRTKHTATHITHADAGASAQYVQVHRRGLGQALEHAVDLLDVQPHVGLPLPAAQHQVIHLFRTSAGPLQHPALRDALNHLRGGRQQDNVRFLQEI